MAHGPLLDPDDDEALAPGFRPLRFPVAKQLLLIPALAALDGHWRRETGEPLTLVLAHDEASALSAQKRLEKDGLARVESYSSVDAAYDRVASGVVTALVLVHHRGQTGAPDLLRLVSEARDSRRPALVCLCPGDDAQADLLARARDVFFDRLVVGQAAGAVAAAIGAARADLAARRTADAIILTLRETTVVARAQLIQLTDALARRPGRAYWAMGERAVHLAQLGDGEEARGLAAKLTELRPGSIDALLLQAELQLGAAGAAGAAVAGMLVQRVLRAPGVQAADLFRAGTCLVRWRTHQALAELLEAWVERVGQPQHAHYFLAAAYFAAAGARQRQGACLAIAAGAAPARLDYVRAFAGFLEGQSEWQPAWRAWSGPARVRGCGQADGKAGLVRCLRGLRRLREADTLLAAAQAEHPDDAGLAALRPGAR